MKATLIICIKKIVKIGLSYQKLLNFDRKSQNFPLCGDDFSNTMAPPTIPIHQKLLGKNKELFLKKQKSVRILEF
jgi:hypothetical protein